MYAKQRLTDIVFFHRSTLTLDSNVIPSSTITKCHLVINIDRISTIIELKDLNHHTIRNGVQGHYLFWKYF